MDKKIAKEAGLHDMGWMGSKSYIDDKLKVRLIDSSRLTGPGLQGLGFRKGWSLRCWL